jgi:hypothetical protein
MVGDNNKKKKDDNSVEIEAYLKPSWVLTSTKRRRKTSCAKLSSSWG